MKEGSTPKKREIRASSSMIRLLSFLIGMARELSDQPGSSLITKRTDSVFSASERVGRWIDTGPLETISDRYLVPWSNAPE